MISLDNGPANGDYVRYIDGLIAATRTTATDTGASPAMSGPTFVPMANMTTAAPGAPPTARMTPAAANAIASAMIDRTSMGKRIGGTATPDQAAGKLAGGLAGVLIGLVLLAFGFFSEPVRGFLVLIGLFALATGARTLTRAVGARVVTTR